MKTHVTKAYDYNWTSDKSNYLTLKHPEWRSHGIAVFWDEFWPDDPGWSWCGQLTNLVLVRGRIHQLSFSVDPRPLVRVAVKSSSVIIGIRDWKRIRVKTRTIETVSIPVPIF